MPSAAFNDSLASVLRQRLSDEIEKEKDILVNKPTELAAGYIRGLKNALALLDGIYADMNSEERPLDRRSSQTN